jgi:hypothetical protein
MKILQVGAELFHGTDRRTDITKIITFFAIFLQPKILLTLLFYVHEINKTLKFMVMVLMTTMIVMLIRIRI